MNLQKQIIKLLKVKPIIQPDTELKQCVMFLKTYLIKNIHFKSLIVGISGGQDSTLTGKICQLAIQELKNEKKDDSYQLIALRLPYGIQKDEKDCDEAIHFINPDQVIKVNIKNAVLSSKDSLQKAGISISDYVQGNEKARERMKVLYSIAAMKHGLVVGTGNASEYLTGFFTKYGDSGTDINPIATLNKRQGRLLLTKLNCPKKLYLKTPTGDLEDEYPQKSDEIILGVTYDMLDSYLEGKEIDIINKRIIEQLYFKTIHKRNMPITRS